MKWLDRHTRQCLVELISLMERMDKGDALALDHVRQILHIISFGDAQVGFVLVIIENIEHVVFELLSRLCRQAGRAKNGLPY